MRATKWLSALAVAASTAWTAGCGIETQLTGTVTPEQFGPRNTMILLARGTNSELTDIFAASNYAFDTYSATDEITQQASGGNWEQEALMDYSGRTTAGWAQAAEAAWSGIYSVQEIVKADEQTGIDPESDPLVARMWLNAGLGERQWGEQFCDVIINYGPDGGPLLGSRGPYDPSRTVGADSLFRRVIFYADRALEIADAGVAAGVPAEDGWYLFDPQVIQTSAHGLKAQAYLYLEQWDLADQEAALVPIDHEEFTHMDPGGGGTGEYNDVFVEQFYDDEISVWGTPAHLLYEGDPRAPWAPCSRFAPGVEPGGDKAPADFVDRMETEPPCYNGYGEDDEYRTEDNRYPRFVQLKYWDDGTMDTDVGQDKDMEMVMGTEMLLIRAEVALEQGRLGDFKTYIDQHRAYWDLDPIDQPATAGALEYPNAEDDGWSILDRERYLDLWLEGRRYMDLRRWQHPYWTEGNYMTPDAAASPVGTPGVPRKWMCFPVPNSECERNVLVRNNPDICGVLSPPGT